MAVIRPFNPPLINPQQAVQPPVRSREAAETRAAARAFFQQALGDATPVRAAPVAAAPVRAEAASPVPVSRGIIRPTPTEPPTRPMRPGSFIDIKV